MPNVPSVPNLPSVPPAPRVPTMPVHVVTGAFGYSGSYIAQRLYDAGLTVRTLTNSLDRPSPLRGRIEAHPLSFDRPDQLVAALRGADVLYNTYWVRFNARTFRHDEAVDNTRILFEAARAAGVRRVVHVSITNPSEDSPLEYFHGKAVLERSLRESGMSHAILRPTVLFGVEDILVNNIAWLLRRAPVFGLFGDGRYRVQPIYVDDLAALAVEAGRRDGNEVLEAIGPETFTFREMVATIGRAIGHARPLVPLPPRLGYLASRVIGRLVGDVFVTWPEIEGLMADLLYVDTPPAGTTRLSTWAAAHADVLGRRYANEMERRRDRKRAYAR